MVKIILSIVAVAILLGVLAGIWVWKAFSQPGSDGLEFGKTNDDAACLEESLARLSKCEGSGCQLRSLVFAHFCFPVAAPSYQLCEGVPTTFLAAAVWPVEQCQERELPGAICEQIHTQAARTCLALKRDTSAPTGASGEETHEVMLGHIPSIDATVTQLRFHESGGEPVDYDNLNYQTRFSVASARYINWELVFEFPELAEERAIDITAIYHWPDGTVMGEMVSPAELEAGWGWSWQGRGWGWEEPGNWLPGSYYVEIYAEGGRVAARSFVLE